MHTINNNKIESLKNWGCCCCSLNEHTFLRFEKEQVMMWEHRIFNDFELTIGPSLFRWNAIFSSIKYHFDDRLEKSEKWMMSFWFSYPSQNNNWIAIVLCSTIKLTISRMWSVHMYNDIIYCMSSFCVRVLRCVELQYSRSRFRLILHNMNRYTAVYTQRVCVCVHVCPEFI